MEPGAQLAYELPALYRRILDAIAELEHAGRRDLAADLRKRAVGTYSRSWDARAHRRLGDILERCNRAIADARLRDGGHRPGSRASSTAEGPRSKHPADDPALGGATG